MMTIRLARYIDKLGVDCISWRQEEFVSPDGSYSVEGVVDISTYGKWCYHAWIDSGDFEEASWDRLDDSNYGTRGIFRYRPEAHDAEIASESIEVPHFIEKMVEAMRLYDDGQKDGPVHQFIWDLKFAFMQAYALGLGDLAGIYFNEDEFIPTQLFETQEAPAIE